MTKRAGALVLGFVACTLAACTPQPGPTAPAPTGPPACQNVAAPTSGDHVALVKDDVTGATDVVAFDAATPQAEVAQVAALDAHAQVLVVEQDSPVSASAAAPTNDPLYPRQWGSSAIDFGPAWSSGLDGSGVRVAVVDTGVQADHPDLDANVVVGKDFVDDTGTASNNGRIDGNGHGTHVAGIIAAEDNAEGVVGGAPHATIVPVRALGCNGAGVMSDVADAILWASDPDGGNVRVINLSLGGPSYSGVLKTAIDVASSRGVVVVAAAGNCGQGGAGCFAKNNVIYPAAHPSVIAVAALDETRALSLIDGADAASTPDSPANSVGGDLDVVAHLQVSDWSSATGPQTIVSKLDPGVSGYEPLSIDSSGTLRFTGVMNSPGPTTVEPVPTLPSTVEPASTSPSTVEAVPTSPLTVEAVSTTPLTETDGTPIWLRVVRQGGTVSFFRAAESTPTAWVPIGDPVLMATGAFIDNTLPLTVGARPTSDAVRLHRASVLRIEVRNAVGGPAASLLDPTALPVGVTSWTAPTGEAWTLRGNRAAVTYRPAPYSNTNNTSFAAPGTNVISTYPTSGYGASSGTSMASPYVAAIAALVVQKCGASPGFGSESFRALLASASATREVGGFVSTVLMPSAAAAIAQPCPA